MWMLLCVQEVESEQYQTYFEPELQARGYGGVFRPKSRARTMSDCSKVDGCAVFYKHDLFELVEETLFEYQTIALHKHDILTVNKNDAGFNRLISKDNIALCLLLQPLTSSTSPPFNSMSPSSLLFFCVVHSQVSRTLCVCVLQMAKNFSL
jgi:mRNA deadenylase 3'-5' endonuclease subunit Ccr4